MAVEVTMPRFGLTMHEGTIQRFFKAVGDNVRAGEPLYEVETEKVLYEVEAPVSGTLAVSLFEEGATVECGRLVAVIAEPGDDAAALAARYGRAEAEVAQAKACDVSHRLKPVPPLSTSSHPIEPSEHLGEKRRPASPVARKLAAELGVNLAEISGTGPGGRITREDVERAAAAPQPAAGAGAAGLTIPLRGARKAIAERMYQSLQHSAQLTITTEADVTEAVGLRARRQFDFTYTDQIIHAAARALRRHPRMNARLGEDRIELLSRVNVGMAVALEDGLIVPVIFDADRKDLRQIADQTRALSARARAGQLKLEDVTGGTFTVTNLGTWGVDAFTPILNLGETGILGVGRIAEKPAIFRDQIAARSMITLSLTFDHRVIDGAPAAAFLQTVIELFNRGAWEGESEK